MRGRRFFVTFEGICADRCLTGVVHVKSNKQMFSSPAETAHQVTAKSEQQAVYILADLSISIPFLHRKARYRIKINRSTAGVSQALRHAAKSFPPSLFAEAISQRIPSLLVSNPRKRSSENTFHM
jgi:hypothetical protein